MKRFFILLLLFAAFTAVFVRFAPIAFVRLLPESLSGPIFSKIRPEIMPTISIKKTPPAPSVLKYARPLWEKDTTQHRILIPVASLTANDAGRHKINRRRLNYLTAGRSFIAIADLSTFDIVILAPDLKVRRKWPMASGLAKMMQAPVAMAAYRDEIAALDRDGTLVWWDLRGNRKGSFKIDGFVYDLDILNDGNFLVHQAKPYPYLLAIYSRSGHKKRQFGALPSSDAASAPLLHQGFAARDRANRVALGLINPYKLFFFSAGGNPTHFIEITPEFQVFEPYAEKLGRNKWRVLRQRVVYDLTWHGEHLYVLVASDPERAADWMEVFSREGEFLQRFYLSMHAIRLDFWQDDLILLGYDPRLKLERFRIERIK
ncbi:MAG: hypothetical protein ACE5I1_03080 [bacterium]